MGNKVTKSVLQRSHLYYWKPLDSRTWIDLVDNKSTVFYLHLHTPLFFPYLGLIGRSVRSMLKEEQIDGMSCLRTEAVMS